MSSELIYEGFWLHKIALLISFFDKLFWLFSVSGRLFFTQWNFLIRISFPFSANDKRLRNVNGVTNPNGGAVPPPVQRTPLSDPDMDNESLDNSRNSENEGYMREVKAIIGGVLGKENNKVKKNLCK